ncbi:class I SAM-dependent methyltransferase [Chryseomicrobium sp. FSL W7-1435]|uniref:class I SAM-dependent methyltransferase n=1 Tax=Chryseomicrobium sp. FSL W7-1435 TaxID=2921704 RepID=UPI00315A8131
MKAVEHYFTQLNEAAEQIENSGQGTYLEGVVFGLERWLLNSVEFTPVDASKEEKRRAIQLAILKGMRKSSQPNHQMTPDALGMIVAFLVNELTQEKEAIRLFDPAIGTGNLMYTVANYLQGKEVEMYGSEIDELLLQLASQTAELLNQPIELFLQDSLRPLLLDPVDVTLSDLPVGYYPDDDHAATFELRGAQEHAYSHHLFIEQAMNYTKEGGSLLLFVPTNLFSSPEAATLHGYLSRQGQLEAVLQLPKEIFKTEASAKALIIIRKDSKKTLPKRDVLLAQVPSLSNKKSMELFFEKVRQWK